MLTFRGAAEDSKRLARRILRMLRDRHAMHIVELRTRLGADGTFVQAELEELLESGEVERLRPFGYAGEDRDFYRVNRSSAVSQEPGRERVLQGVRHGRDNAGRTGETVACLAD